MNDKIKTMLIEIGATCGSFAGMVDRENARLLKNFEEVSKRAVLAIERRDERIKELEQELKISDAAKEWAENQLALTESDVERLQAKLEAALNYSINEAKK